MSDRTRQSRMNAYANKIKLRVKISYRRRRVRYPKRSKIGPETACLFSGQLPSNSLHIPKQESDVSTSKDIFPIGPLNNAYG